MSKIHGLQAETHFSKIMNEKGIPCKFIDSWTDFTVYNEIFVEVKSCELKIEDGKKGSRNGRYEFTNKQNRELQYESNCWICFILRKENQYLIQGFVRAKKLNKKQHWTYLKVEKLKPLNLEKWTKKIQEDKTKCTNALKNVQ